MKPIKNFPFSSFRSFNPLQLPRMVINPFRNRIQNIVESILLSGTVGRLFIAALVVGGVAFLTGLLGYLVAMGTEQSFPNPWDAIWWAFLRLSDPGYLGDDEGFLLRTVSTVVTVAGYVLFLGVLVAILTQGLNETIRKLEMGLTPIRARHHIILLGWMNRTPWIVRDFIISETRVKRFLQQIGARQLKLVLLVEEAQPSLSEELRTFLGPIGKKSRIIFRSGSPLRLDHLMRVDYLRASAIVLPAKDRGNQAAAVQSDNATVKTILSISHSLQFSKSNAALPLLVAELYDSRKIPTALYNYHGPIEVVAGDEVLSRMIAQMTRNPQISYVFRELLSQVSGNEVFIRDCEAAQVGALFWEAAQTTRKSILIGVTRHTEAGIRPFLNPPDGFRLEAGDKLVYIAEKWQEAAIGAGQIRSSWGSASKRLGRLKREDHHVLILGWSRRLPALLEEYESYQNQQFAVTIASRTSLPDREEQIQHYGCTIEQTRITHVDTDYTIPDALETLRPEDFDTVICLTSDLTESDEEADACNLVAYTILKSILSKSGNCPRILIELLDELNVGLIDPADSEYLLSPHVLSHMLVQISLRRDLNSIFQELFNSSDTEILFRNFERYGLEAEQTISFDAIEGIAREHSEVALGYFKTSDITNEDGGVDLNPDPHKSWKLETGDQFVVLRN